MSVSANSLIRSTTKIAFVSNLCALETPTNARNSLADKDNRRNINDTPTPNWTDVWNRHVHDGIHQGPNGDDTELEGEVHYPDPS